MEASSAEVAAIEARGWRYILGARPRATKEVGEVVLGDVAPFEEIEVERQRPRLEVKDVVVGKDEEAPGRRYIVCRNPEQAARDAAKRTGILEKLEGKLRSEGPKGLVANRGFRRYLQAEREAMVIDEEKIRSEEQFDGIWVLRTNAGLKPTEVALRYRQLWMVERLFRHAKNLLETRPVSVAGKIVQCLRIRLPSVVRRLDDDLTTEPRKEPPVDAA